MSPENREVKELEEDLEDAELYYSSLFEKSPEGIVFVDREGKVVKVNESFSDIFGYSEEEVIGKHIDDLVAPDHDEDRSEEFSESTLEDGEVVREETVRAGRSGEEMYVSILTSPIEEDGQIKGGAGIYRDITEVKERELMDQALNSMINHDLGNKLTVIDGYIELLKDTELNGKQRKYVDELEKCLEGATEITERVNSVQKAQRNRDLCSVDIDGVIREICEDCEGVAEDRGFELEYDIESGEVLAGEFIDRPFENIISNSIEHSNGDRIEVDMEVTEGFYRTSIMDNGEGLPEEKQEELFGKKSKFKEMKTMGGLYISKKIIEGYEGRLELDGEYDGAKFDIYLKRP
ncbi:MAG: PAS domain S-box protein [Candidatus Aenigmatarchaeota archaeon]